MRPNASPGDNEIFYTSMRKILSAILAGGLAAAYVYAMSTQAQNKPVHPAAAKACLAPATWYTLAGDTPQATSSSELLAGLATRDIVLLGEQHDDADHHQWQLQTLAALHLLRPQMVIGFEAFPRRVQPTLDKWTAGELTVKQFLEQVEWEKVWNFAPELYMPLFQFARINRVPMVALNVERTLTEAISRQGWDAVPTEQKEGVSRPAPASEGYNDFLFEVLKKHPQLARKETTAISRNDAAFRFFVESQTTWDRAFAEALARRVNTGEGARRSLVVGIVGDGHVRHGYGVAHQLRDLGVSSVGMLLPVNVRQDCDEIRRGFADAVFAVPGASRDQPPPPRLGVRLEEADGSVRVAEVSAGSLAEKSGLQRDDRIVSVAGAPVTKLRSVVAAVRVQPAGTWLPMQIRRGTETLDLVIKFPLQK